MLTKTLNKKQIIIVTAASLTLVLTAVGVDLANKSQHSPETESVATPSEATPSKAVSAYRYSGISSKLTEIVEDKDRKSVV